MASSSSQAVVPAVDRSATRPKRSYLSREQWIAMAIVSPSILAVAIFVYGFIAWSLRVSMSAWDRGLIPNYDFVGLKHYIDLTTDRLFRIDMINTVIFTVLFVGISLILGLLLALLLDQHVRGESFFRSVFLFPMALSFIVTAVAWRWLMNPATGSRTSGINLIFKSLGLDFLVSQWHLTPPLNLSGTSIPIGIAFIVIPAVWQMSGFTMAMYLGGLRSISDDLREAARVDGASEFQIFRHIILPLLQPVTLSAVIVLGHISLKVFDLVYSMGQHNSQLDVPAVNMYRTVFDGKNYAGGAAIGIVILVMVALLIIPYLIYSMRTETEL